MYLYNVFIISFVININSGLVLYGSNIMTGQGKAR